MQWILWQCWLLNKKLLRSYDMNIFISKISSVLNWPINFILMRNSLGLLLHRSWSWSNLPWYISWLQWITILLLFDLTDLSYSALKNILRACLFLKKSPLDPQGSMKGFQGVCYQWVSESIIIINQWIRNKKIRKSENQKIRKSENQKSDIRIKSRYQSNL